VTEAVRADGTFSWVEYADFDLVAIRAKLGLSRVLMAKILGWSVARLDTIEKKRLPELTIAEWNHAVGVLTDRIGERLTMEADELKVRDRIIRDTPKGSTRLVEWEGFECGQTVRIRNMPGSYKFLFHHTSPLGTVYVQVYGGTNGHGAFRSVSPDRIIRTRSKTKIKETP
jgi:hypothetical protein